jgi:protein-S-isoprenylcysteine O-methyltransferase Ste14
MSDWPAALLAAALWAYWSAAIAKAIVLRLRHGRAAGLFWPRKPAERWMWPIWVPVVVAWNLLPWLALRPTSPWFALPAFQAWAVLSLLRFAAAAVALGCLFLTVLCWARMGGNWSVAVVPEAKGDLVQSGPYALVRHPIYALSVALMLCSLVVVPTLPMLALALLHVPFLVLKARSEERSLAAAHGSAYVEYCRRVGRFLPLFRPRTATGSRN